MQALRLTTGKTWGSPEVYGSTDDDSDDVVPSTPLRASDERAYECAYKPSPTGPPERVLPEDGSGANVGAADASHDAAADGSFGADAAGDDAAEAMREAAPPLNVRTVCVLSYKDYDLCKGFIFGEMRKARAYDEHTAVARCDLVSLWINDLDDGMTPLEPDDAVR